MSLSRACAQSNTLVWHLQHAPVCVCARAGGPPASPLLLHADAASRKLSLRCWEAQDKGGQGRGPSGGQLRMADLKFAPSLNSLVCLRCRCVAWAPLLTQVGVCASSCVCMHVCVKRCRYTYTWLVGMWPEWPAL